MKNKTVVELSKFRFPVGCKAWHKKLHVCYVVEQIGEMRKVKSLMKGSEKPVWVYEIVHLDELKADIV